jgi:hypothetical protein
MSTHSQQAQGTTVQQAPGIRRTNLQEHDLGIPGRMVIENRVELGRGAQPFRHWHPGERGIRCAGSIGPLVAPQTMQARPVRGALSLRRRQGRASLQWLSPPQLPAGAQLGAPAKRSAFHRNSFQVRPGGGRRGRDAQLGPVGGLATSAWLNGRGGKLPVPEVWAGGCSRSAAGTIRPCSSSSSKSDRLIGTRRPTRTGGSRP